MKQNVLTKIEEIKLDDKITMPEGESLVLCMCDEDLYTLTRNENGTTITRRGLNDNEIDYSEENQIFFQKGSKMYYIHNKMLNGKGL